MRLKDTVYAVNTATRELSIKTITKDEVSHCKKCQYGNIILSLVIYRFLH